MSKPLNFDLTPLSDPGASSKSKLLNSKPALRPALLAYRLRCLSDELTRLAQAVPEKDQETCSELLRARDAIWFAAKRVQSAKR